MSEQQKQGVTMVNGKVYNILNFKPEGLKSLIVFKNQADPIKMANDIITLAQYNSPDDMPTFYAQVQRVINNFLTAQIGFPETIIEEVQQEQQENQQ